MCREKLHRHLPLNVILLWLLSIPGFGACAGKWEIFCVCDRHSGPQGHIEPFTIVDDPSAWLSADYKDKQQDYIYTLTPKDLQEVEAAIALVESRGLTIEVRTILCNDSARSREVSA